MAATNFTNVAAPAVATVTDKAGFSLPGLDYYLGDSKDFKLTVTAGSFFLSKLASGHYTAFTQGPYHQYVLEALWRSLANQGPYV